MHMKFYSYQRGQIIFQLNYLKQADCNSVLFILLLNVASMLWIRNNSLNAKEFYQAEYHVKPSQGLPETIAKVTFLNTGILFFFQLTMKTHLNERSIMFKKYCRIFLTIHFIMLQHFSFKITQLIFSGQVTGTLIRSSFCRFQQTHFFVLFCFDITFSSV